MECDVTVESQTMDADIVCVGYGPAAAGFLYTLSMLLKVEQEKSSSENFKMPQVLCYERSDDVAFGVSGVVTKGRSIRRSIPDIGSLSSPAITQIEEEHLACLLDPIGASRRSPAIRTLELLLRTGRKMVGKNTDFVELPYLPEFLQKAGGFTFSLGPFCQWISARTMELGFVQIWPGSPVAHVLIDQRRVAGVQLMDQGVNAQGKPEAGFMPGIKVRAGLTVVADGPTGIVGRELDRHFGLPPGFACDDWAVGMKMVVALNDQCGLKPGAVFHTFGYPEPEIFGFMYVHPGGIASLGIFVPSWFRNPVRTCYRYMQHWMQHPFLWRFLKGATMQSWGAKSLQESGRRAEPYLVGDGYARIGEGSGTTNILTGSGVDEAWESGVLLAEAVMELWVQGLAFSKENLEKTYVHRRRRSWLETEAKIAERARDGFSRGLLWGLAGMGLSGMTKGWLNMPHPKRPGAPPPNIETYYSGRLSASTVAEVRRSALANGQSLHDALMDKTGWPPVVFDGKLLMSHQDALLIGGKVQAPAGYADHVRFVYPKLCQECGTKLCVEICSGQAITPVPQGWLAFDREKCVHCGACYWSCHRSLPEDASRRNLDFQAGAGGLHSAEN
jgi:electron-transferring-flavoprotein dehydrogenase